MIINLVKQSISGVRSIFAIKTILIFLVSFSPNVFPQLAAWHDKFLGNASDPPIPATFDMYWNQLTPSNAGKWGTVEGTRDQYNWTQLDQDYEYAMERGFAFKHHILVQGSQQPGWIAQLDSAEQAEEVEEWFKLVGERYPDLTLADVVGEVISNQPSYKIGLGGDGVTGWDWVINAFQLARQFLPSKTKLVLLEANIINGGPNISQFIQIINLLKDRNLIDGIGLVAHNLENVDTITLRNSLDQLAATGVDIYVHSLDIGSTDDNQQLTLYRERFPILWEHSRVKGITLWGYIQGQMFQPNGYLLRTNGTERPALSWLREYLTLSGTYRSFQSGNWNDVNTWEQYDGTTWIHPAPASPSAAQAPVTILSGHTITVTANDSGSNILIAAGGILVINSGVTFTVKNSNKTDITVKGTVANSGILLKDDAAEIIFANGGRYSHLQDGGLLPTASWKEGSTILFEGITSTAPSNTNQDFYNVEWNCPAQTINLNLEWNGITIGGDITTINTGSAGWYICGPQTDSSVTVNLEGDIIITEGQFSTNGSSNGNTTIIINHSGNINVTGGNFSISRGSQGETGVTIWNLTNGNFSMSNATTQNSNPDGAKFVFSKQGKQNLTLGTGNTLTALPIEVINGTTLSMGTSVLEGTGSFVLNGGGTIETSQPEGIDGNLKNTGTINLSSEGGYNYIGSSAQVTGSLLPDTIANLTINNVTGVSLSNSVLVTGVLELREGNLLLDSNQLFYGTEGSLKYSGSSAQTTSDIEFPSSNGPKNIYINNTSGVTLHASRTIPGNVEAAGKLILGENNLTAETATNTGLTRFIVTNGVGELKLTSVGTTQTLFPIGTSFYAPVWVTNDGTEDTIGISVVNDSDPASEGGRVKVKWNINENTDGGGDYTIRFGWSSILEDAEFRSDREFNARIFNLTDTTEAGSGEYTIQFDDQPRSISRGGITTLGPFAVGLFAPVTGVDVEKGIQISYSLSQNYPNPFNPTTKINYSVPKNSFVTLKVYNLLGEEVTTLFEGFKERGNYTATFDASGLSSGIYIYRMIVEHYTETKKTIFLR